jgi:hypothetical protein
MRREKHQQISKPGSLRDIESCLLLDSVSGEWAIASAEDSESWVWVVLDLVIDFPKLALTSLLTSIAAGLRRERQHHSSDELRRSQN